MFDSRGTMSDMAVHFSHVSQLILEQLAIGERRVLSLIVSVSKAMNRDGGGKGNSSALVRSALSALVKARTIVEVDGMYSLSRK
jgi:hypothetical protein